VLACVLLSLVQEESAFTGVASQCLSVLVLGINTHLDASLQVICMPHPLCHVNAILAVLAVRVLQTVLFVAAAIAPESSICLCLQDMLRMRWDAIESPGDDSPYVSALRHKLLSEVAPRLGATLDKTQFSFFCDKMGRMFVPRFIDAVYKLRK